MTDARPAATVILLRDSTDDGIEVWLMRRVQALAFAGGASVFPGGRVDEADRGADVALTHSQPAADPAVVAQRFGCSIGEARASIVAAVRETFEETGVLLTRPRAGLGPRTDDPGRDPIRDEQERARRRRQVEAHEVPFTAVLGELGLVIDADLVRPWAHWITPMAEPRRYDTHFFVAAMPEGASADADTTEAVEAQWIAPAAALAEYDGGRRPMLAPTVLTLRELAGFASVDAVLAAAGTREIQVVAPEIHTLADGRREVRLPDGRLLPPLLP